MLHNIMIYVLGSHNGQQIDYTYKDMTLGITMLNNVFSCIVNINYHLKHSNLLQ